MSGVFIQVLDHGIKTHFGYDFPSCFAHELFNHNMKILRHTWLVFFHASWLPSHKDS